jgi:hypothetical protein
MNKEENSKFIRKSESLVKPEDVTAISFLGDFNKLLSKKTQHKIMVRGSRKIPYMGFIVEPYCLFLSYRINNTEAAQAMLPEGYEIAEASFFKKEEKYPMVVVSAFSARTSAFIGTRLEFYIIARNTETGLLSWIIADYETDTNSHDPKNGFCGYTSDPAVFTVTPYGELLADFKGRKRDKEFSVCVDFKKGEMEGLDETLWIEGNLSVDYGGELKDESSKTFGLIFDPFIMKEALNIPIEDIEIKKNSYLSSIIDYDKPVSAAVFPYSQHFIIKQDLKRDELMKEADLNHQIMTFLGKTGFKMMSGNDIKKPLYRGILISGLIHYGLIIFLLLKLLL